MSRLWSRASGPGWAMLPTTAGFVDPLHSTGIAHGLRGVERIAELLLADRHDEAAWQSDRWFEDEQNPRTAGTHRALLFAEELEAMVRFAAARGLEIDIWDDVFVPEWNGNKDGLHHALGLLAPDVRARMHLMAWSDLGDPVRRFGYRVVEAFANIGFTRELIRLRDVRHGHLMGEAGFVDVKRGGKRENRLAVLDRLDAARGEAAAIADALDIIDDRDFRIAGEQKIAMERMGRPTLDGAACSDKRLPDDLPAEDTLPADLRTAATEEVLFEDFEIENSEKVLDGGGHGWFRLTGFRDGNHASAWRRMPPPAVG
jgi:hypothetical protein